MDEGNRRMRRFAFLSWPSVLFIGVALVLALGCQSDFSPVAPSSRADLELASVDDVTSCNGLVPTIVGAPPPSGVIYGTSDADVIVGTELPDSIYGGTGDDTICGLGGSDWVFGEDGNDTIHGNAGADSLYGDTGDDGMYGDTENDFLDGGAGRDTLFGGTHNDHLLGGSELDNLWGEGGADYLDGGEGPEQNKLDGGKDTDSCVPRQDRLVRCELFPNPDPPPPPPPPPPPDTLPPPPQDPRPNFLIIITDDQRFDSFQDFMPITYSRIAQQGVDFTRAYATTPLCCPSRASIMTGMYARHHGVSQNPQPLTHPTFVVAMHAAGYATGQIGKYLNSCCASPRPEFDYWASPVGDGGSYFNPQLNVNGVTAIHSGYITYVLRDRALDFLSSPTLAGKPFLLFFNGMAPHTPSTPAPGDEGLYNSLPPHRPPNFNEADISDKPSWLPSRQITSSKVIGIDTQRRNMLATLWSMDQAIGAVLDKLQTMGQLDRTFIVFMSDNGFMWGEHRLFDRKNLLYEEAARIPFAVRYPPLTTGPRVETGLVANIDIAPTVLELAGLPIPAQMDGKSMIPLVQSGAPLRQDLLLEAWSSASAPPWIGLRTESYMYIERAGDISELYDMLIDPYQLQNVAGDPANAALLVEIRARLSTY
jgi:arylsulfatase A-like enzyme